MRRFESRRRFTLTELQM